MHHLRHPNPSILAGWDGGAGVYVGDRLKNQSREQLELVPPEIVDTPFMQAFKSRFNTTGEDKKFLH